MLNKKPLCPICKCICKDEDDRNKHLEETHNNIHGPDIELIEKTTGKELLNECNRTM